MTLWIFFKTFKQKFVELGSALLCMLSNR